MDIQIYILKSKTKLLGNIVGIIIGSTILHYHSLIIIRTPQAGVVHLQMLMNVFIHWQLVVINQYYNIYLNFIIIIN